MTVIKFPFIVKKCFVFRKFAAYGEGSSTSGDVVCIVRPRV